MYEVYVVALLIGLAVGFLLGFLYAKKRINIDDVIEMADKLWKNEKIRAVVEQKFEEWWNKE